MKKLTLMLCLLLGCTTGEDEVTSAVTRAGFTEVKPGRLTAFGCSDDDKVGRLFTARNAQGVVVEGQVCCGVLKGCTIRY